MEEHPLHIPLQHSLISTVTPPLPVKQVNTVIGTVARYRKEDINDGTLSYISKGAETTTSTPQKMVTT
jgi:hypothetical protein